MSVLMLRVETTLKRECCHKIWNQVVIFHAAGKCWAKSANVSKGFINCSPIMAFFLKSCYNSSYKIYSWFFFFSFYFLSILNTFIKFQLILCIFPYSSLNNVWNCPSSINSTNNDQPLVPFCVFLWLNSRRVNHEDHILLGIQKGTLYCLFILYFSFLW